MLDFDKATPSDPDASTAWVYLLYGATMSTVQTFEHSLAFLSIVVTTNPYARTERTIKEQLPRIFDRWWRAYQKDAAGRTLRKIKGRIPEDLYADTETFIKRRNWLAHRFFIEQLQEGDDGQGRFARGTILKLTGMAADGAKLTTRLDAHNVAVRANWPAPAKEAPPEVQQWFQDFAQLVMRRRVRPEVWVQTQTKHGS